MKTEINDLKTKLQLVENLNLQFQEQLFQNNAKSTCGVSHRSDEIISASKPVKNDMKPTLKDVSTKQTPFLIVSFSIRLHKFTLF